jgi:molecular chaperone DnaK
MSQEDIDRAVKDAEKFAEEDKKQKEAVDTKNHAEALVYQSEKTLEEIGDKLPESDKTDVKLALETLKNTVNTGSTEDIKRDTEALEKAFYALSEKLYAQQGGAQGDPGAGAGFDGGADAGNDGTYYDTGFDDNNNA